MAATDSTHHTSVFGLKPADPRDQELLLKLALSLGITPPWAAETSASVIPTPAPETSASVEAQSKEPLSMVAGPCRAWEFREREHGEAPAFNGDNARRLVRELKAAGVGLQEAWDDEIKLAARRLKVGAKNLRTFLRRTWGACTTGTGLDGWDEGAMRADAAPVAFRVRFKKRHDERAAALAYHLSRINRGGWFPFGSDRLAPWLGVHRDTADDLVWRLAGLGLIDVLTDKHGRTVWGKNGRKARMIRWVGDDKLVEPTGGQP